MGALSSTFKPSDFGLDAQDLQDMNLEDDDEDESDSNEEDEVDPIAAERKRRQKRQDMLKRSAGEPIKPKISEIHKMMPQFLAMLRMVLAE